MPDIKSLTAAELLRLYRKRELSPVEVTRDQLDRIEQVRARDQRLHHRRSRRRAEGRAGLGGALAQGRACGARGRPRRDREGQCLAEGFSLPARLGDQRPRADEGGRARGRAAARERRDHSGQDHAAGIRLDRRLPFAAHRHHAQSVEARSYHRRLVRRRRGRGAAQSRPPAYRHRRRRLDPHSGGVHRRVRHQAELWPRGGLSGLAVQHPGASRTADAHGRGCGADAFGDRPAGRARHDGVEHAGAGFPRRA